MLRGGVCWTSLAPTSFMWDDPDVAAAQLLYDFGKEAEKVAAGLLIANGATGILKEQIYQALAQIQKSSQPDTPSLRDSLVTDVLQTFAEEGPVVGAIIFIDPSPLTAADEERVRKLPKGSNFIDPKAARVLRRTSRKRSTE